MPPPRAPVERTCVACRSKKARDQLIRFAASPGRIEVDPSSKIGGRGAYACRRQSCIDAALSKGRLARALRTSLSPTDAERLRQQVVEYLS